MSTVIDTYTASVLVAPLGGRLTAYTSYSYYAYRSLLRILLIGQISGALELAKPGAKFPASESTPGCGYNIRLGTPRP